MKIKRYYMEDWLNDSRGIKYNLTSSGCEDLMLKDFLRLCNTTWSEFDDIFLGDNDTRGSLQLRKEVAKSYRNVSSDEVMVTNGSSEAIFAFFNELLSEGDEVVIPFPSFQCLYQIPISIGCKVRFLDLLDCKDWRLDLDKLSKIVNKKTKLIIINNPHNPFGWTLNPEELKRIGEIAEENDCYLFFDEHYRYLPLEKGNDLIPSGYDICKRIHDKTYATGSMIKCFGIVGIRIGWLLSDEGFYARCRDYKDYITHTIPEITDRIAYLSLKNQDRLIERNKRNILKNLKLLDGFMDKHAKFFDYVPPTGGVVCFPRLKINENATEFCSELVSKYGVSILPGSSFQVKDHIRINIGRDSSDFKASLSLIEKYLDTL